MTRIPSQTFYDYHSGVDIDIPPTEFAQLQKRVTALENAQTVMNGNLTAFSVRLNLMEEEVYRREYVFKAGSALSTIGGGLWKVCGLYRVFESLVLQSVRGYSLDWPDTSSWQIIALRTSGAQEVQNISQFMFEVTPPFGTMNFESGDVLGVLVRNFRTITDETGGTTISGYDNPAMCSMVFRKRTT